MICIYQVYVCVCMGLHMSGRPTSKLSGLFVWFISMSVTCIYVTCNLTGSRSKLNRGYRPLACLVGTHPFGTQFWSMQNPVAGRLICTTDLAWFGHVSLVRWVGKKKCWWWSHVITLCRSLQAIGCSRNVYNILQYAINIAIWHMIIEESHMEEQGPLR